MQKNFSKLVNNLLWGNSVALAWTWGIGLFFSVQIAIQFGFEALIKFVTIDALGLMLFGLVNDRLSRKFASADDFEQAFLNKAKNYKFALLFYQFLAVTLTLFTCIKYLSLPLGVLSILVMGVFFGATIFLGEEFDIKRIKYSHAFFALIIFGSLLCLINSPIFAGTSLISTSFDGQELKASFAINSGFASWFKDAFRFEPLFAFSDTFSSTMFYLPIIIGFIAGPWLDLQNWQRVIQIRKEGSSLTISYIIGALIFWSILMIDGMLAITCFEHGREFYPEVLLSMSNLDPHSLFFSAKSTITKILANEVSFLPFLPAYLIFVALSALTTFDSAYIAYKWYLGSLLKDAKGLIFSFVQPKFITSPILGFIFCIIAATLTVHFGEAGKFIAIFDSHLEKFFRFELEYYLAFYAAFFVIYAAVLFRDINNPNYNYSYSGLKLFAAALSSLAVFGIGYFGSNALVMALGSVLPFIYGFVLDLKSKQVEKPALLTSQEVIVTTIPKLKPKTSDKNICSYDNGWFVHHFVPTYQDTNSVGNVYFAMYLMWVGKTRELFFNEVIPNFDPKTSKYLILTRSIEHKFQKEIKEFDEVTIELRIADYNRKFVTLEHRILTKNQELVGKGKQVLIFVDSSDYKLLDLPQEIQQGFLPFVAV